MKRSVLHGVLQAGLAVGLNWFAFHSTQRPPVALNWTWFKYVWLCSSALAVALALVLSIVVR